MANKEQKLVFVHFTNVHIFRTIIHRVNLSQAWHKASLGKGNSILLSVQGLLQGEVITNKQIILATFKKNILLHTDRNKG